MRTFGCAAEIEVNEVTKRISGMEIFSGFSSRGLSLKGKQSSYLTHHVTVPEETMERRNRYYVSGSPNKPATERVSHERIFHG